MSVGDTGEKPFADQPQREQMAAEPQRQMRPWSAFEFRDYRILWLSSAASLVAMQLRLLVAGVWLYAETGSGIQLGLLGIVQLAVQLPGILFGGAMADQLDRKRLIAFTQGFSLVFLVILTALMAMGNLRPWHIYAVTAILGLTSVLGQPARSAITANIVPRSHLMHAVTSNTATFQIGAILAPLSFAVAFTRFGPTTTFAVASAFAVPATLLPLFIRTSGVAEGRANQAPMLSRMWEGFLFVKTHPILPGLYLMDVVVTIVSYYRLILPLIADKLFKAGAGAVGVLNAANSFGGVGGTFAVLFMARFQAKGMLVIYATLAYALLLIAFGLNTSLWVATVIIIGLGASDAIGMTIRQTTVQLTTPDNMRGRAVSFHSISAMSANNLGTFEVGFMSQQIGAGNALALGGVVGVVAVLLVWWLLKGIREYRYP